MTDPLPTVPPEAVTAAVEAIQRKVMSDPGFRGEVESDDYYRVALEAAAPHIRAAAVEEERQFADDLKLGGTGIEVAALRAAQALGIDGDWQPGPAMRALKDLYRAGVATGMDIALRGEPEPEAVAVIRKQAYDEIRQLAIAEADRLRGGNFGPRTADVKALFDFADLIPGGETGG